MRLSGRAEWPATGAAHDRRHHRAGPADRVVRRGPAGARARRRFGDRTLCLRRARLRAQADRRGARGRSPPAPPHGRGRPRQRRGGRGRPGGRRAPLRPRSAAAVPRRPAHHRHPRAGPRRRVAQARRRHPPPRRADRGQRPGADRAAADRCGTAGAHGTALRRCDARAQPPAPGRGASLRRHGGGGASFGDDPQAPVRPGLPVRPPGPGRLRRDHRTLPAIGRACPQVDRHRRRDRLRQDHDDASPHQ